MAVPLVVGTSDTQRQHVLGVFQFPPVSARREALVKTAGFQTVDHHE
ncbi:MAG: hypothetical protein IPK44_21890 [Candidatus Accumulibacter sp.]|jgi:hypothetical protein|nr:hypothetical protein [Accumulibacter sp.]MBK8116967.1 hypothetical protein [Accumulibacter sp.]